MIKRITFTSLWGLGFWLLLNILAFTIGLFIVKGIGIPPETAGRVGRTVGASALIYGIIPTIVFTAWAGISSILPGIRHQDRK